MTPNQSLIRLSLYVAGAMIAAASAGLGTVDFSNRQQVVGYALSILGTGIITARSYIDKSPSEVLTPGSRQTTTTVETTDTSKQ